MATKKSPTKISRIPDPIQYVIEKDPTDPNSRAKFAPAKLALEKSGSGGFRVTIQGDEEPLIKKKLEVIFLTTLKEAQCQCSPKTDSQTTVCYSRNRVRGNKGHLCASQCPYAEPGKDKDDKLYTRPLKKTTFLLVRDPKDKEGQFILCRYFSVMNNIKMVDNIKSKFSSMLARDKISTPFPGANVALVPAIVENNPKGKVGRFGSEIEFVESLTPEEIEAVTALNTKINEIHDQEISDWEERTQELGAKLDLNETKPEPEPGADPKVKYSLDVEDDDDDDDKDPPETEQKKEEAESVIDDDKPDEKKKKDGGSLF